MIFTLSQQCRFTQEENEYNFTRSPWTWYGNMEFLISLQPAIISGSLHSLSLPVGNSLRANGRIGQMRFADGWRRRHKLKVIQFASLVSVSQAVVTLLSD